MTDMEPRHIWMSDVVIVNGVKIETQRTVGPPYQAVASSVELFDGDYGDIERDFSSDGGKADDEALRAMLREYVAQHEDWWTGAPMSDQPTDDSATGSEQPQESE